MSQQLQVIKIILMSEIRMQSIFIINLDNVNKTINYFCHQLSLRQIHFNTSVHSYPKEQNANSGLLVVSQTFAIRAIYTNSLIKHS